MEYLLSGLGGENDFLGLDLDLGLSDNIRSVDSEVDYILYVWKMCQNRDGKGKYDQPNLSFIVPSRHTFSGSVAEDRSAYMTSG
jgi:hypothetical protein